MGDGMIDAACGAIQRAAGVEARLVTFNVSSVTGGSDAFGDVVVQLDIDGRRVTGRGVAIDVVEATARAYLAAINRALSIGRRGAGERGGPAGDAVTAAVATAARPDGSTRTPSLQDRGHPGDGTGPEVVREALKVLEAVRDGFRSS